LSVVCIMKVYVKLFATLTRSVSKVIAAEYPEGIRAGFPMEVELSEGSTLADLVAQLALPREQIKVMFVNGRDREFDYRLEAGDNIGIFPPVAGG
jgi:molybdopterin synthase sulfur carrier subunit